MSNPFDMRKHYEAGQRVQISPAYDAWMRGDRYGEIVKVTAKTASVKLDKSGRILRVNRPTGIYEIVHKNPAGPARRARRQRLPLLTTIAKRVRKIIERAERAGVAIDDGNVVDLIADNISTNVSLNDIRDAIVVAGLAARFPNATRRHNPAPRGGHVIRRKSTETSWAVYNEGAWIGIVYARGKVDAMRKARNRWGGDPSRFTYEPERVNPAPRIGTLRSGRRSQITGRAPSRRLVSRRRRNVRKGFFPNPRQSRAAQKKFFRDPFDNLKVDKRYKPVHFGPQTGGRYIVQKETRANKWETLGGFHKKAEAIAYARIMAIRERKRFKVMDAL